MKKDSKVYTLLYGTADGVKKGWAFLRPPSQEQVHFLRIAFDVLCALLHAIFYVSVMILFVAWILWGLRELVLHCWWYWDRYLISGPSAGSESPSIFGDLVALFYASLALYIIWKQVFVRWLWPARALHHWVVRTICSFATFVVRAHSRFGYVRIN